jgi:hypothetical protein
LHGKQDSRVHVPVVAQIMPQTIEEKYYRLKGAMKKIGKVTNEDVLPKEPNLLMAISLIAPNLADFLTVVGEQLTEVADILDEEHEKTT